MAAPPTEIRLTLEPRGRFDVIDVAGRIQAEFGDVLGGIAGRSTAPPTPPRDTWSSGCASRLLHHRERLSLFFKAFGAVFPPEAAYEHDKMHLRAELSEAQRAVEPRNGDSHLTFIGTGMSNCVRYRNRAASPVYFIDLDGMNQGTCRQRRTSVVGYDHESGGGAVPRSPCPPRATPSTPSTWATPRLGLFAADRRGAGPGGHREGPGGHRPGAVRAQRRAHGQRVRDPPHAARPPGGPRRTRSSSRPRRVATCSTTPWPSRGRRSTTPATTWCAC